MKLRIRSVKTKETIRIEIPDSQSVDDLKALISGKISSPSSPISPQTVRFSLNRKDELVSSPGDSLQSLGLTSGDLLFYSLDSPASLSEFPNSDPIDSNPYRELPASQETLALPSVPPAEIPNFEPADSNPAQELSTDSAEIPNSKLPDSDPRQELSADSDPVAGDGMEVDVEPLVVEKGPSLPCFLKRVLEAEEGEVKGNLGLIVVAVHAVFVESGFVICDGSGYRLPEGWALSTSAASVKYTVPELLGSVEVKHAVLKFSLMEKYVLVYGSLSGDVYRLCLDASKMAPLLVSSMNSMSVDQEREIFEFWKIVKDRLSLPLMVDTCEKNGLPPPPCFARLPTDLKAMILELLPGVDVARIGCTSSEMRYLALNDELWKKKFVEEYGMSDERAARSWKEKFVSCWVRRMEANKRTNVAEVYRLQMAPRLPPLRFGRIPMFGGDYDLFPGGLRPVGSGGGIIRHPAARNFSPQCNLGGHNLNFSG